MLSELLLPRETEYLRGCSEHQLDPVQEEELKRILAKADQFVEYLEWYLGSGYAAIKNWRGQYAAERINNRGHEAPY
jgi:hypothetical protein